MKNDISQLCDTYDQSQEALCDPRRRGSQDYYLGVTTDTRRKIEVETDCLLRDLPEPIAVAELTYFNTWFNRRGGWSP